MKCPKCDGKTSVLDSREREYGGVMRRRICTQCKHRFMTVENVKGKSDYQFSKILFRTKLDLIRSIESVFDRIDQML